MIRPHRIEVTNIRSVAHAVLTPADGITALTGPIGAGKSTMLDALAYALYGEGIGLSQADMRRRGAAGSDPCEVTATVQIGADTYVVTRGVRQRSARGAMREEAYARLTKNGMPVKHMTSTRLTALITEATGLSGRAYLGAFYIPQGQLTTLTEATPSQVQEMFEAQTGLAPLTKQITVAQTQARDARAVADALPGSAEEVEVAQEQVNTIQETAAASWEAHEAAAAAAGQAATRLDRAATTLAGLRDRDQAAAQARVEAAQAKALADREAEAAEEARAQAAAVSPEVEATARRLVESLARTSQEYGRAATTHENARTRADDLAAQARAAEQRAQSLPSPDALTAALDQHRSLLQAAEETRAIARADYDRTKKVLAVLEHTHADTGRGECPTCGQDVTDLPALLAQQRQAMEDLTARGKGAARDAEKHTIEIRKAEQTLTEVQEARTRARHALESASDASADTDCAATQAAQARTALVEVLTDAGHACADDHDPADVAARVLDEAHGTLTAAEVARQAAARADRHDQAAKDACTRSEACKRAAAGAPDAATLRVATDNETTARRDAADAESTASEARTKALLDAQAVDAAEKARDEAASTWSAKQDAAHKADVASNAAALLSALRRDLLVDYTQTVSAAATEIMQTLGGEHTGFTIGEDFIPRVLLADGTTRATRLLSGGEKARAALCFRLGITHQITGGAPTGMLLADEITAAHDETTRQAVVQMLADLGIPLLIVAHTDDVAQIASQVVRASKDGDGTRLDVLGAAQGSEPRPAHFV